SLERLASVSDALQLTNRFADIVERDSACNARQANARCHNESDFSVFEFLIELQRAEDLFARKRWGQTRGQLVSLQEADNRIALIRRQASPLTGDRARGDNSKAHRFSVQKFPVISGAFNRVTNRVTEIKNSMLASLVPLIFRNDF